LAARGSGFILDHVRHAFGQEHLGVLLEKVRFAKSQFDIVHDPFLNDPGYDRDGGPVSILGLHDHVEY
jgi:hypothetical protein